MATTENVIIQPNAVNDPLCSSDSVWYKDNENVSVSDKFDEVEAAIATKANSTHSHTEYASSSHTHSGYAETSHTHTEYAASNHAHTEYAGAEHTHTGFAVENHTHDYAATNHDHDEDYSAIGHNHSYNDLTNKPTIPSAYTHPASHPASMITGLSEVATTGSYNDLSDKPAIPSAYAHPSTHPASMITGLADVATSGSYNDLSDKPTIPTVPASLPANGGNADTVDGKHAADFATASHNHDSAYANTSHNHTAVTTSAAGFMSAADKTKLDGIATSANAYTHPTTSGNKHIPSGGSSGQILRWSADGTAVWGADNNTTYSAATTSAAGLMSASDKSKLDGIATGANNYTLPTASSTLGGVKTTSTVTSTSGLTACPIISGVPYYKDTNTTYSLSSFGITATAAELNKMDGVTATTAELNYVDGVTSNIQTQLNAKASTSHNHDSDYLSLDGGTVNGDTNIAGVLRVQGNQAYYYNTSSVTQVIGTNNATGGTTICNGTNANMYINGANIMTPNCLPRATGTYYCGNANYRWKGIYSAAAVNVSSDERLKENIEDVNSDEAVNLINGIDVKSFNYIGNDEPQIGVMAQDILAKSPELAKALVTEDEDGYYGVKTSDLVFPLIIAVQRLQNEINELKRNMQ